MKQFNQSQPSDEVDIRGILDLLVERKKSIALTTVVFVILGVLYAFIASPVYRANITVQVEDPVTDMASTAINGVLGGLSSLFSVKSTDDGEMELLRSRLVTTSAVDAQRLYIDAAPKRFPLFGEAFARHSEGLSTPGIFGLGGYVWGREKIGVTQFDVPDAFLDDKFLVTALGDGRYELSGDDLDRIIQGQVGVPLEAHSGSGPILVSITSLEGRPGAQFVLHRRSREDTVEKLQDKIVIAELGKNQSGVISVKLEDSDPVKATAILNAIADRYVEQNRQRKAETADQSLRFLEGQLPDVRRQLQEAEDRLTAYQSKQKVVNLTDQSKAILGQYVDASTAVLQLEQKRRELLGTLSQKHPQVVALDRQIEAAKADVSSVEANLWRLPTNQQGMVRLTRDVQVQTQLYISLLNSVQQLQLARAGGVGNVRVVDHAVVPAKARWPKPLIILVISFVAGLFAGIASCVVRATLTGVIRDPNDVEQQTLTDVTAVIPVSAGQRRIANLRRKGGLPPYVLAERMPRDPAIEALKLLRTSLQLSRGPDAGSQIVLVTGPTEGLGKSFTATNLSVLLGRAGKRTLLIDADMHRGRLNRDLGQPDGPGFAELLSSKATPSDLIIRSVSENLDLLRGGSSRDPDELFEQTDVRHVLRALSDRYDFVIVDSPPVLGIADTALLRPAADVVLLVVRSGRTTSSEVIETNKRLQRAAAGPVNVVFNGFTPGLRSKQYGYYGYAGGPSPKSVSEPRSTTHGNNV